MTALLVNPHNLRLFEALSINIHIYIYTTERDRRNRSEIRSTFTYDRIDISNLVDGPEMAESRSGIVRIPQI